MVCIICLQLLESEVQCKQATVFLFSLKALLLYMYQQEGVICTCTNLQMVNCVWEGEPEALPLSPL